MIKKGIVSALTNGKASVHFPDMNNLVANDLAILKLTETVSVTLKINDVVLVAFWGEALCDGAVIGRVI
jgi:hypothetical protein